MGQKAQHSVLLNESIWPAFYVADSPFLGSAEAIWALVTSTAGSDHASRGGHSGAKHDWQEVATRSTYVALPGAAPQAGREHTV